MAKVKKLPKTLFVKREEDGDTHYFVADEEINSLVDMSGKVWVGTYKLVGIALAETMVKVSNLVKEPK